MRLPCLRESVCCIDVIHRVLASRLIASPYSGGAGGGTAVRQVSRAEGGGEGACRSQGGREGLLYQMSVSLHLEGDGGHIKSHRPD